jgi:hypothetical protein
MKTEGQKYVDVTTLPRRTTSRETLARLSLTQEAPAGKAVCLGRLTHLQKQSLASYVLNHLPKKRLCQRTVSGETYAWLADRD